TEGSASSSRLAYRQPWPGPGLVGAGALEDLDDVAVRIAHERLVDAVATRHRPAADLHAPLAQPRQRRVEVVNLERKVRDETELQRRAGRRRAGAHRRVVFDDQMHLVRPRAEPCTGEGEAGRTIDLLETERVAVEAPRALEVADHERAVLDAADQPDGLPATPQCFGETPWTTTWMFSFAAPLDS